MNLSEVVLRNRFLIGVDTRGRRDELSMSIQSAWRIEVRQASLKGWA